MTANDFKKLLQYDLWANTEALKSVITVSDEQSRRLFSHILEAQLIWISRLKLAALSTKLTNATRQSMVAKAFHTFPIEECEVLMDDLKEVWKQIELSLNEEKLFEMIHYKKSTGEEYSQPIHELLFQLINHGTYHRGQIALAIKNAGGTASSTDFILWTRQHQD